MWVWSFVNVVDEVGGACSIVMNDCVVDFGPRGGDWGLTSTSHRTEGSFRDIGSPCWELCCPLVHLTSPGLLRCL